jgi:tetratricopeptide (TPR) repeat protein
MGNHKYAIADFQAAIELDASSTLGYFYMGISKLKLNNVREAIKDLT